MTEMRIDPVGNVGVGQTAGIAALKQKLEKPMPVHNTRAIAEEDFRSAFEPHGGER